MARSLLVEDVLRVELEPQPPAAVAPDVRRGIWSVDPELPLARLRTMGQIVAQATFQRRFQTWLGAAFAACALLVAALGIYGIIAYSVVQRRTELGIRIALGAGKRDIYRLVLRQGARPVLAGLCAGVALALVALILWLIALGLVLFVLTLVVLAASRLLIARLARGEGART